MSIFSKLFWTMKPVQSEELEKELERYNNIPFVDMNERLNKPMPPQDEIKPVETTEIEDEDIIITEVKGATIEQETPVFKEIKEPDITIPVNYRELYESMVIRPEWQSTAIAQAKKILAKKDVYERTAVQVNKNMPWYFIGIIHMLESSLNFTRHLHNGDHLKNRTVNVPKGRPLADPILGFITGYTWQESAIDALKLKNFHKEDVWSVQRLLYRFHGYNGFGYEKYHNMNSPYLWSGSYHYIKGKYTSDGKFDSAAISGQVGTAILLYYLTDAKSYL